MAPKNLLQYFPLRLLLLHLKRNLTLAVCWLFLFSIILGDFGRILGLPYLLLDPEYLGHLGVRSMAIMGLAFGFFSFAFHLTGFILYSEKFRFLAGVRNPFLIYYLNNGILPTIFLAAYGYEFASFQIRVGTAGVGQILYLFLIFLTVCLGVHALGVTFFLLTRSKFLMRVGQGRRSGLAKNPVYRIGAIRQARALQNTYQVSHFLALPGRWLSTSHLQIDKSKVWTYFRRNHLTAYVLAGTLIGLLFFLGYALSGQQDRVPAAASCLMFMALLILLLGVLGYWLKGWGFSTFLGTLILINMLYVAGFIKNNYEAPGLEYDHPAPDTALYAAQVPHDSVLKDTRLMEHVLGRRLHKFATPESKPKAVILCFSGGGQRAALWAYRTLAVANEQTGGGLWQNAVMLTGASGGMIGAALFRESQHRHMGRTAHDSLYEELGRDLLNPIIFTYLSHDIPFRFRDYLYRGRRYSFDRGRAFDLQFHANTHALLNKTLDIYLDAEKDGFIPWMLLSPIIASDGRKMMISNLPSSFMTLGLSDTVQRSPPAGVEFMRTFGTLGGGNLDFITALRMNATFPYVMPNLSMPCEPPVRLMDAGLADNYGISTACRFTLSMRKWLEENTSGVVMLSIRDSPRSGLLRNVERQTLFSQIFNPIGSLYSNWSYLQENHNDQLLTLLQSQMGVPVEYLTLEYRVGTEAEEKDLIFDMNPDRPRHLQERASLSWHLTEFEKMSLYEYVYSPSNRRTLARLKELIPPASDNQMLVRK